MIPALAFWHGSTVHTRLKPFTHRFKYPVAMMGLDLDRLDEAKEASRWFRVNRFGLFSFHEKDFGAQDGSSLKEWAFDRFSEAKLTDISNVYFVFQPRILGYQFNPISLHFGYSNNGELKGIIYEVHNTFGDAHSYVAPVNGNAIERHEADKNFHVSPFFDVSGQYEFALQPPEDQLGLTIRKTGEDGANFRALMTLKRKPVSSGGFARWFFGYPISTLFTIGAIHFEALRLVMKGARYHKRPEPPAASATPALASNPQKR